MANFEKKSGIPEPSDVQIQELELKLSQENQLTDREVEFLRAQIVLTKNYKIASRIMSCFQWLHDPANVPFVIPFLRQGNPDIASRAVWTLCWLGAAGEQRDYLIECLEPGMHWDPDSRLAGAALTGIGQYLSSHKDRDLAQLMVRWQPRPVGDPCFDSRPVGRNAEQLRSLFMWSGIGMGYAMGADPLALTDDESLVNASVQRFLAERQDG